MQCCEDIIDTIEAVQVEELESGNGAPESTSTASIDRLERWAASVRDLRQAAEAKLEQYIAHSPLIVNAEVHDDTKVVCVCLSPLPTQPMIKVLCLNNTVREPGTGDDQCYSIWTVGPVNTEC